MIRWHWRTMAALSIGLLAVGFFLRGMPSMNAQTPDRADPHRITIMDVTLNAAVELPKVTCTDAQWRQRLTPDQYNILRTKGTEHPGTGSCTVPTDGTLYRCAGCGADLFASSAKFVSGTGWPSFTAPVDPRNIKLSPDFSHGMTRTEVTCALCDGHLGHVFDDGPPPTGQRFCINSIAFVTVPLDAAKRTQKAVFAAGCFWGVESAFRGLRGRGVIETRVGYTGGHTQHPTYEQVCSDSTGHAEAVEVTFDTSRIRYEDLLDLFFEIHDPTTLNRQGPDVGSQYRSAIFAITPEQAQKARRKMAQLTESKRFARPIVTQVTDADVFWPAEEYHQRYFEKKGIAPTCHLPNR